MSQPLDARAWVAHLRDLALLLPEAEEGISCNRLAFRARDKAFLFVSDRIDSPDALLKLRESLPDAEQLASSFPENVRVGAHGWVTLRLPKGDDPPEYPLERWLQESYRLVAPKKLVMRLGSAP